MPQDEQDIPIKCPHCGFVHKLSLKTGPFGKIYYVIAGADGRRANVGRDDRKALDAANARDDFTCNHCQKGFRYDGNTGKVERLP